MALLPLFFLPLHPLQLPQHSPFLRSQLASFFPHQVLGHFQEDVVSFHLEFSLSHGDIQVLRGGLVLEFLGRVIGSNIEMISLLFLDLESHFFVLGFALFIAFESLTRSEEGLVVGSVNVSEALFESETSP